MNTPQSGMDLSSTHRLGPKAFLVFFMRHVRWSFLALILSGIAWYYGFGLPEGYREYGVYAGELMLLISAAWFFYKGLRSYFEYRGYAYRFDKEFFHVTRGYVVRQEIGVVYHHIQTVTLRRGIADRFLRVCDMTISMTSSDTSRPAEVVLPALEDKKARLVQQELLRQARLRPYEAVAREEDY